MQNFIQKITDRYYIKGLPRLLYITRNLCRRKDSIYTDPDKLKLKLNIDNYFQNNIRFGYYEPTVRMLLKQILRPGDTMLDIGGNIGYLTCVAASLIGEKGKVFTFEPNPEAVSLMNQNILLNNLHNVKIMAAAVGEKKEEADLFVCDESAFSTMIKDETIMRQRRTIKVPVMSIDQFLKEEGISSFSIKLVKIDIEGFEYFALKGMSHLLQTGTASFIIENNAPLQLKLGVNFERIANEFFFPFGYSMSWFDSKDHTSFFYRKNLTSIPITNENIHLFNDLLGDILVQSPSSEKRLP